jgi:putative flippase GtrA
MHTLALRLLGPQRAALLIEFLRFGTVGMIGFAIDNATVYGLRAWVGLYWAGAFAYLTGATANWLCNRLWTFRGRGSGPAHRQWAKFLAVNLVGFVLNRGTYAVLITFNPTAAAYPVLAILAGTVAGMFLNFHFSRRLVFR